MTLPNQICNKQWRLCLLALLLSFLSVESVYAQVISPGVLEPKVEKPLLPQKIDDEIIRVPVASERSLDPQQGPDINVSSFSISYDRSDLIEANHINELTAQANRYLEKNSYTLSFSALELAADTLTEFLRAAGYLLAKVVLPPQEIEAGIVHLRVFVGVLGSTSIKDNELYTSAVLQLPFEKIESQAVIEKVIVSKILRINDLPGIKVAAVFSPGTSIGETELGLRVTDESYIDYYARVDNYGVESTGELRGLTGLTVNNITGHRDRLAIDLVKTFDSGDLRNARVNYEITMPNLLHTLGLGYSETRYEVDQPQLRALEIEGNTKITDLYLRSSWIRQQEHNFSTDLGLSTKRAEVNVFSNDSYGVDKLTVLSFGIIADQVDTKFKGLHRATLYLHQGFNNFIGSMDSQGNNESLGKIGSSQILPGDFQKLTATYNRLQALTRNHSLLFRFAGQYSDDQLSSLEKMSLGGPYTVRAYSIGETVSDRAIFTSLAWVVEGGSLLDRPAYDDYSWNDLVSFSLFADYGWGKNINSDGSVTRREIDGWGLDIKLKFPDRYAFADFTIATPFSNKQATNGDHVQFWLALGVEF